MKKYLFPLLIAALPLVALEEEELVWDQQGPSVLEYNRVLQDALASQDWWGVLDNADVILYNFPTTPFAQECAFHMGYAYYQMGQLEHANESLSAYLNHSSTHSHFEEAIQIKFDIAESFRNGVGKPLFGSHKMPKWASGKEDALQIYEEVITTLPHSEIAAKSLLGKAKIQAEIEDYKPSVETLQTLIRRFPKEEAAAEAFLEINKVYLEQCKNTSLDLDLLDLAEVNLRKFRLSFPREPRLIEAEQRYAETQELFAANLLETGLFFERTKKIPASIIYFNKVIQKYPHTEAAQKAKLKLEK